MWTKIAAFGMAIGVATAMVGMQKSKNTLDTSFECSEKQTPKNKATRADTNPNAVLKQITANHIKMNPDAITESKKIVEQVSLLSTFGGYVLI